MSGLGGRSGLPLGTRTGSLAASASPGRSESFARPLMDTPTPEAEPGRAARAAAPPQATTARSGFRASRQDSGDALTARIQARELPSADRRSVLHCATSDSCETPLAHTRVSECSGMTALLPDRQAEVVNLPAVVRFPKTPGAPEPGEPHGRHCCGAPNPHAWHAYSIAVIHRVREVRGVQCPRRFVAHALRLAGRAERPTADEAPQKGPGSTVGGKRSADGLGVVSRRVSEEVPDKHAHLFLMGLGCGVVAAAGEGGAPHHHHPKAEPIRHRGPNYARRGLRAG